MVSYNSHFLNIEYCNKVIEYFDNLNQYKKDIDSLKSVSRFYVSGEDEENQWIRDDVNNLVKQNLGNEYYINSWLVVLKYEKGDYYHLHDDASYIRRWSSGGVELNDKSEYQGGEFVFGDEVLDVIPGQLFTHTDKEFHEVKEITSGTRYSLHFNIFKETGII
jgi:hypothetical protein